MLISVPLGVATALFLNEIGGRMARPVRLDRRRDERGARRSSPACSSTRSFVLESRPAASRASPAALALSVLMLPTVTRTSEEVLRLVPGGLREGALALGGTEWRTTRLVVLPTARAG